MADRPILFSGEMVRAILRGDKTQTRRVVNFPEGAEMDGAMKDGSGLFCSRPDQPTGTTFVRSPYGQAGDRLWVRETHLVDEIAGHQFCAYRATCPDDCFDFVHEDGAIERIQVKRWRPSIFMRREWSRITLEITEVRVQRLKEIADDDARAEGVTLERNQFGEALGTYYIQFADLWTSINGKRPGCSWWDNPWVWCVSFRRVDEVGHG